jgi:hypothetical protein
MPHQFANRSQKPERRLETDEQRQVATSAPGNCGRKQPVKLVERNLAVRIVDYRARYSRSVEHVAGINAQLPQDLREPAKNTDAL